jgi:hypothetical protein
VTSSANRALDACCRWSNEAQLRYVERVSRDVLDDPVVVAANEVHQVTRVCANAIGRTDECARFAQDLRLLLRFHSRHKGVNLEKSIRALIEVRMRANKQSLIQAADDVKRFQGRKKSKR